PAPAAPAAGPAAPEDPKRNAAPAPATGDPAATATAAAAAPGATNAAGGPSGPGAGTSEEGTRSDATVVPSAVPDPTPFVPTASTKRRPPRRNADTDEAREEPAPPATRTP